MGYGALISNFQEISHALHNSPEVLNLVANQAGTRIYDSTRGYGRFWKFYYDFSHRCFDGNSRLKNLIKAVRHTHEEFCVQVAEISGDLQQYHNYLSQKSKGYPYKGACFLAKKNIIQWNHVSQPLLKNISGLQHRKWLQLLSLCFNALNSEELVALFKPNHLKTIKEAAKIIAFEEMCAAPLPLEAFKKIFKNKSLNSADDKEIALWIKKINKIQSSTQVHEGILALRNYFSQNVKNGLVLPEMASGAALEILLEKKGCTIFKQSDLRQVEWRSKWREGKNIEGEEETFQIGERVRNSSEELHFYKLSSHPSQFAVVPLNRSFLSKIHFEAQSVKEPAIQPAAIDKIFNKGKWGITETLYPILPSRNSKECLNQESKVKILSILDLLKKCIKEDFTPSCLNVELLMFDKNHIIKTLQPVERRAFNFLLLEDFLIQYSLGNQRLFSYLIDHSGLNNHPVAKFFCEIVRKTLSKERLSLENLAGIFHIDQWVVLERAQILMKRVNELYQNRCIQLQKEFPDLSTALIENKAAEQILNSYKERKIFSSI